MPDPTSNPLHPPATQKASTSLPTVGRIVHVHIPAGSAFERRARGPDPIAAIVTRVNDDGTIEVSAFMPRETDLTPIHSLKHESQATENDPRWRWPFIS